MDDVQELRFWHFDQVAVVIAEANFDGLTGIDGATFRDVGDIVKQLFDDAFVLTLNSCSCHKADAAVFAIGISLNETIDARQAGNVPTEFLWFGSATTSMLIIAGGWLPKSPELTRPLPSRNGWLMPVPMRLRVPREHVKFAADDHFLAQVITAALQQIDRILNAHTDRNSQFSPW
ncbi:hypothetical protein M8494_14780 [Serratia ureilytica]